MPGMGDLISRFQKLSEAPEFSFLQKRGIFFMNQFLHPSAPSVTKGPSRAPSLLSSQGVLAAPP